MGKRLFISLIALVLATQVCFAATYDGKRIKNYSTSVVNVDREAVQLAIKEYVGEPFSSSLYKQLEADLLAIDGVKSVKASVAEYSDGETIGLNIDIVENPVLREFKFTGHDGVKRVSLSRGITAIETGSFFDLDDQTLKDTLVSEVVAVLHEKGFGDGKATMETEVRESDNSLTVRFVIEEGQRSVVKEIGFEGNGNVSDAVLKKEIASSAKGLFSHGYLNPDKVSEDASDILSYYQDSGYINAKVSQPNVEELYVEDGVRYVALTFNVEEGERWWFGGITLEGNEKVTNEEVAQTVTLATGAPLNLTRVQTDLQAIADIYYNNGYINCQMNLYEDIDEETRTIAYVIKVVEGEQATIQAISITGMTKTKEYVLRRELAMKEGDIFSKAALVTSYQNLYNTGLLSNLDYQMFVGDDVNSVILEFIVEEGSQMDIQFGATFGGSADGSFPVSGFLQWADRNLGGRGQNLDIGTQLSPDTQSVSVSFGDNWVGDVRWSNTISLGIQRKDYKGELQLGTGLTESYNGRNGDTVYPLGYSSVEQWKNSNGEYPDASNLMDYKLFNINLGYSTGYTWIFPAGRLGISTGLSIGLNRASYDSKYTPFEQLIASYGEGFKFSNRLSTTIQWDGRDFVTNTTKGYLVNASFTYAGGLLGGLSQYNKLSVSAAGYLKLFSFNMGESKRNVVASLSTTASFMFPQWYTNSDGVKGAHAAREGATQYEMLYIDGMTSARGHNVITDQSFMLDNILEIGFPLIENVLQAETFVSATALAYNLPDIRNDLRWYYAAGFGVRFKISGFPLGIYLVKDAVSDNVNGFQRLPGSVFSRSSDPLSGMRVQLAISMSLI